MIMVVKKQVGNINPRTAFWGPFGPQTILTVDVFVIFTLIMAIARHTNESVVSAEQKGFGI